MLWEIRIKLFTVSTNFMNNKNKMLDIFILLKNKFQWKLYFLDFTWHCSTAAAGLVTLDFIFNTAFYAVKWVFSPQLHFPHSCEEMVFELKGIGLANLIRYSDLCYPQQKLVASPGYWTPVSCVWSQDSTTELSCLCWKWGAKLLNKYYTNIFWDILATNKKQQIK